MPTLTQLEYIVAVDRLRHFAKAAEACCISQPSLSMQIQKAEKEIGFALFDRHKKPVLPTTKGRAFVDQARIVLNEHRHLLHLSHSRRSEVSGAFRLGVIPTLAATSIPGFLSIFSEKYPKVDLSIDEMKTERIIHALRNDSLDAGLLSTPLHEAGIVEQVLFQEPFFLYVNPRHALANRAAVDLKDLEGGRMWLLEDGHCFKNQVVRFCSSAKLTGAYANIHFEGGSLETLRQLVKQSPSFTLVPELFIHHLPSAERKTMIRPFRAPMPSREVSLAFRRNHWKKEIIAALRQSILDSLPRTLHSSTLPLL